MLLLKQNWLQFDFVAKPTEIKILSAGLIHGS